MPPFVRPSREQILARALSLAGKGYHLFPVRVRVDPDTGASAKQYPTRWVHGGPGEAATRDPEVIRQWWAEGSPLADCLIGIATEPSGIVVIDLDTKHGVDGHARWTELCPEPYPIPAAVARSPTDGRHEYYRADPKRPVKTSASEIAPGVDTRGVGGMVVHWGAWLPKVNDLPPVPDVVVARAPAVRKPTAVGQPPSSPAPAGPTVPHVAARMKELAGELADAPHGTGNDTAARIAFEAGQYVGAGQLGQQEAVDALVGAIAGWTYRRSHDEREMVTTIIRQVEAGMAYPRPWEPPPDFGAAVVRLPPWPMASAPTVLPGAPTVPPSDPLASPQAVDQDLRATWARVDLGPYLTGAYVPPTPTLMPRADGPCLLYPGLVHSFHGESESGKSWVVQCEAARLLMLGEPVLYVDFESEPNAIIERLLLLGVSSEAIERLLDYRRPEGSPASAHELPAWQEMLAGRYALAAIDGVTDAMGLFGKGTGDNDEVAAFLRVFPRRLASCTGAAVALVDHVVKDPEHRGRYALGGQHKLAGLDGAAYTVDVVDVLGRGLRGVLTLRVAKDRPGQVRGNAGPARKIDRTQEAARFVLDATGEKLLASVEPWADDTGPDGTFRPTQVMENISRWLEGNPRSSLRVIRDAVQGKNVVIAAALECLVTEGHVDRESTPRGGSAHTVTRPYRQTQDPGSEYFTPSLGSAAVTVNSSANDRFPTTSSGSIWSPPKDLSKVPSGEIGNRSMTGSHRFPTGSGTGADPTPATGSPVPPPYGAGTGRGDPQGMINDQRLVPDLRKPDSCPCGRAISTHSEGQWITCRSCGQAFHRFGVGGLPQCPTCHSGVISPGGDAA